MDTAIATSSSIAAARAVTEPAAPWLVAARSGSMPLPEVMERAAALQTAGDTDAAARLYETWIACTASPLRHVACFNWGTLLPALGRDDAAQAAYEQALATSAGFAPARLNLGHLCERRGDAEGALQMWRAVFGGDAAVGADLRLHALNNSARLLETARRYPEAEVLMRRSLELNAAQPDVIQHYVHIRQKQCA